MNLRALLSIFIEKRLLRWDSNPRPLLDQLSHRGSPAGWVQITQVTQAAQLVGFKSHKLCKAKRLISPDRQSDLNSMYMYCQGYIFRGTGERNGGYALLMKVNKPETAPYRAPTFSLLPVPHGQLVYAKLHKRETTHTPS